MAQKKQQKKDTVSRMLADLEEQAARARAQSHFTLDAYADALSNVYESMLS